MEIVHSNPQPTMFRLRESFLKPYYGQKDPFKSLLARSTYLNKYSRNGEVWTDTIRRVVEGNMALAPNASEHEAEMLYHLFWTGQALPPGRGLWVGGVDGIPADARYNCWYTTLYSTEDWCWVMNMLMLGGGVGVGLGEIDKLPTVSQTPCRFAVWCRSDHHDVTEVEPNDKSFLNGQTPVFRAPDSREGWVEAFRRVMIAAFEGRDLIVDVSDIRQRGLPIRTFGGTACGPGPLTRLLRSAWSIVREAAGRRLTSVECLDITNMIGFCVKSGNVRRSALIALGDAEDQAFRDAKKDFEKVLSHRHTSNNSIIFRSWDQIANFDWNRLIEDNLQFGEPGVFNLPLVWKTDPGAKGVNPCLTADTRVATQFGLIRIGDLTRTGQALNVTTDARVQEGYRVGSPVDHQNPMVVREAVPAFKTSDAEEVYRLTTSHGYTIKATKYHKFPTPDGFVEVQNLTVGDSLLLQSGEGQWGSEGDEELGHIIGWVEGDGNFSSDSKVTLRFWGEQKAQAEALLPSCQKLAATIPSANGRAYSLSVVQVPSRDSCEITSERLYKALAEVGYREKGAIPEVIWRGTRDCVRGYLRGLFATDGQVQWSKDKQSFSIRLSQSNPGLLREVQTLLLNFGIVSSVYKRRDAGVRRMPDGKNGMKDYWCEEQFDLVIAKQNAVHFAAKIGFFLPTHSALYNEWKAAWVRGPYAETYTDEIRSIEFVGVEPVFCTTQPSHHTFIADGIVTGNCGEQALHDHEACNLAENFPGQHEAGTDSDISFRLLVRYCIRQRLTPLSDPVSHEVGLKNMRVGVALGGLCDFDWSEDQLAHWFRVSREEANKYADELRVNRPITVTTVKPSGTISLLNGSSPGIHAPFAPFYLRRARIAKNDPMVEALTEAGVPHEVDQYDKTGHTLVFAFPTKAAHTRFTVQTETIRDQFERQRAVQENWADNAVSATLSFDANTEREELARCLKEHVPHLKSTTVLSKSHGYVQAPYEQIDELTYQKLASRIQHDHPLVRGGEFEMDECASGVCPVR
jgi:ribonucleotide reductase alpha subunit